MARPKVLGDVKRRMVSLPEELSERVDDYRFEHRIRTESEAIRRLIEAGLKGAKGAQVAHPGSEPGKGVGKSSTPRKPRAKPLAMSKEAQIRALRERDAI